VDLKVPPAHRDRKALKGTPERADLQANRDRKALKANRDPPARRDLKVLQAKTGNSGRCLSHYDKPGYGRVCFFSNRFESGAKVRYCSKTACLEFDLQVLIQ
jgi:hypothetical protein